MEAIGTDNGLSSISFTSLEQDAYHRYLAGSSKSNAVCLVVPENVWEARAALLQVFSSGEIKDVQQQFDRDTLNQAYKLIHPHN
ncbi:hypothetical protein H6F95_16600 [Cyanobacteria bacterium FACHB-471]|nr:hypothetical protein [Cyanobacteria bacterium FACHB-471]